MEYREKLPGDQNLIWGALPAETKTSKGTAAADHTATLAPGKVCDREMGVGLTHPEQSFLVARPALTFLK